MAMGVDQERGFVGEWFRTKEERRHGRSDFVDKIVTEALNGSGDQKQIVRGFLKGNTQLAIPREPKQLADPEPEYEREPYDDKKVVAMYHAVKEKTDVQFCEQATETNLPGRLQGPYRLQGRPYCFTATQTGERRPVQPYQKKAATNTGRIPRRARRKNKKKADDNANNGTHTDKENTPQVLVKPPSEDGDTIKPDSSTVKDVKVVSSDPTPVAVDKEVAVDSSNRPNLIISGKTAGSFGISEYRSQFVWTSMPEEPRGHSRITPERTAAMGIPLLNDQTRFSGFSEYASKFEWPPSSLQRARPVSKRISSSTQKWHQNWTEAPSSWKPISIYSASFKPPVISAIDDVHSSYSSSSWRWYRGWVDDTAIQTPSSQPSRTSLLVMPQAVEEAITVPKVQPAAKRQQSDNKSEPPPQVEASATVETVNESALEAAPEPRPSSVIPEPVCRPEPKAKVSAAKQKPHALSEYDEQLQWKSVRAHPDRSSAEREIRRPRPRTRRTRRQLTSGRVPYMRGREKRSYVSEYGSEFVDAEKQKEMVWKRRLFGRRRLSKRIVG